MERATEWHGTAAARAAVPAPAARAATHPRDAAVPAAAHAGAAVRRLLLALFVIFLVFPALLMTLAYWSAEIPDPAAVQTNQIATITASDGTTVLAKVVPPEGNRTPVPLSDVPQPVRDAMLSAEDRNFYTNPGYSASAFLRAARDNVLSRDDAGAGRRSPSSTSRTPSSAPNAPCRARCGS